MWRHTRLLPRLALMASAGLLIAAALSCGTDRSPAAPSLALWRCTPGPEVATGIDMDVVTIPCPLDDALPLAPRVFTGWSEDDCLWSEVQTDLDQDGVDDSCERATAAAFAPVLIFASHDCSWDQGLSRMGGEYYYAAASTVIGPHPPLYVWPTTQRVLRVAYLMAYYFDCGTTTSNEFVPSTGHYGDSEFLILDAAYDTTSHHWVMVEVFTSAHYGDGFLFDRSHWRAPMDIQYWLDNRPLSAPYIWVARGKHGNYPSEEECVTLLESCQLDSPQRFPVVYVQQNVGSREHPFRDCDYAFSGSSMTNSGIQECMWSSHHFGATEPPLSAFGGWQAIPLPPFGGASTPYGQILADFGF